MHFEFFYITANFVARLYLIFAICILNFDFFYFNR